MIETDDPKLENASLILVLKEQPPKLEKIGKKRFKVLVMQLLVARVYRKDVLQRTEYDYWDIFAKISICTFLSL